MKSKVYIICKICGRKFRYSNKHRIYCSTKCNKQGQVDVRHIWYIMHIDIIKKRRDKNPNTARTQRRAVLKKKYGMTPGDYSQMWKKQKGRCVICKQPVKLHVDHNHKTGKVRGLLCSNCNTALGSFKDNIGILQNAIKYLRLR